MRIAITGTHFSGKSTLVEALSEALPHHIIVEEPYRLLEEEGYEFPELPSLEDFELQLERSIEYKYLYWVQVREKSIEEKK